MLNVTPASESFEMCNVRDCDLQVGCAIWTWRFEHALADRTAASHPASMPSLVFNDADAFSPPSHLRPSFIRGIA